MFTFISPLLLSRCKKKGSSSAIMKTNSSCSRTRSHWKVRQRQRDNSDKRKKYLRSMKMTMTIARWVWVESVGSAKYRQNGFPTIDAQHHQMSTLNLTIVHATTLMKTTLNSRSWQEMSFTPTAKMLVTWLTVS